MNILIKPITQDTPRGLNSSDLNTFTSPPLLTRYSVSAWSFSLLSSKRMHRYSPMIHRERCPSHLALTSKSHGAYARISLASIFQPQRLDYTPLIFELALGSNEGWNEDEWPWKCTTGSRWPSSSPGCSTLVTWIFIVISRIASSASIEWRG